MKEKGMYKQLVFLRSVEDKEKDEFLMLLPGVKADDVRVNVVKGVINVEGISESLFVPSPFYANIELNDYHDAKKTTAYIQRGILTIEVPYKEGTVFNVNVEG